MNYLLAFLYWVEKVLLCGCCGRHSPSWMHPKLYSKECWRGERTPVVSDCWRCGTSIVKGREGWSDPKRLAKAKRNPK